jgi:patatin-related protein
MAESERSNAKMKSREIRLGLVMYGGVSLAIYINGVAHEFFRAVRGNGVYKWLKTLADSDIIVDVISGSSAGGMNGILLAYALCNNKDFAAAAELWRRDGDIRSLLRVPDGAAPNTRSLLDSRGYYQPRLEEAFRFMIDYEPRDEHEKGFNTRVKELDLFVTGTDVDGNIATVFDDAGHPIDVKDHRAVFLLKHRHGRKQPFDPKFDPKVAQAVTYEALAKLARITSCFPAAFEPVTISYRKPDANEPATADDLLREWGRLSKETTFLDGGVIDNKPFTHTLREIFGRAATRQVERILFYVEPDPEFFQQRAQASQPNFLQTILSALVGIPGYESISDDLKLLSNRNRKLNQYRRLLATAGQDAPAPDLHRRSRLIVLSDRVVQGILREDGRDVHLADPEQRKIGAALFAEFDRIYGVSAGENERRTEVRERQQKQAKIILYNFDIYFRLRRLRCLIYKIYDLLYPTAQEPSSGQPASSAAQPANNQPATNAAQPANGQPESDKAARESLQDLWQTLNWRVEVLEIIAARMEKMLDNTNFKWQEKGREAATTFADEKEAATEVARQIWREVDERMRGILAAKAPRQHLIELHDAILQMKRAAREADADEQTSPGLNKIKEAFRKFYEKLKPGSPEESPSPDGLLLRLTDDQEKELFEAFAARFEQTVPDCDLKKTINALRQDYNDFEAIDARRLPLELMGDLFEKDHIETIRISPADADKGFSNKGLSDKVAGDALYHFASFFKRSWRANDILWGRLDGLCQIVEALLKDKAIASPARLREFFFKGGEPNQGWEPEMEPEYLFPNAGRRTHDALRSWIENLAADDEEKNKAARARDSLTDNVKLLIEAAQLEVLHAEAPTVINDALAEQARWNQFRAPRAEAAQPRAGRAPQPAVEPGDRFAFHPAEGSLDQFVGAVAAAAQSFTNTKNLKGDDDDAPRPIFTRLGKFFRQEYRVGNEQLLRDLPQPVLLEILAVTLLVMRNCILEVFGANAGKVKANWLYRFGVDFPLRAFYGATLFMRRATGSPTRFTAFLSCRRWRYRRALSGGPQSFRRRTANSTGGDFFASFCCRQSRLAGYFSSWRATSSSGAGSRAGPGGDS